MGRPLKEKPSISTQEQKALAYWLANPVEAVKDWFNATPDDWQGDLLNSFISSKSTFDRAAVKSAHGPGKTAVEAWAGWVFLRCYEDSRVVATAPTMAQLGDVLWPEYAKWHARFPAQVQKQWTISGGHIRSVIKPKLWFAVARTSNKPANLQGFHGSHIFIQCDEASGVPQDVFEVIEGALSEAGEEGKIAKLLLAGNPNFTQGELHDAFKKNRNLYHRITVTGDRHLLSELHVQQGEDHRDNGRVYFSKRVKEKYRATIEKKYGRDGAVYDVRVRGMFPRQDDRAVIPLEWAERAKGGELPAFDPRAHAITLVLDPGRLGGNETVLGEFRCGVPCAPLETRAKTRTHEAADMVSERKRKLEAEGLRVENVIVDEPGVGGGVIDELEKRGIAVTPYHGGRAMHPPPSGTDDPEDVRMFQNRRARDWWKVRRMLELRQLPLPNDETLVAQLSCLKYDYSDPGQKIVMESKKELKDRLGDEVDLGRADVIVMGCAPYASLEGAVNIGFTEDDIDLGTDNDRPVLEGWA